MKRKDEAKKMKREDNLTDLNSNAVSGYEYCSNLYVNVRSLNEPVLAVIVAETPTPARVFAATATR